MENGKTELDIRKKVDNNIISGFLIGSVYLGWLSDRIGRKKNIMLTLMGMLLTNLVSAFTYSFSVYLVSRFIVGVFLAGNILSAVTLLTEIVGPSYRAVYNLFLMGSFSCGIVLLSVLANYLSESWRMLTFSVSIIGLPFLLLQKYLIESPRWLLGKNGKDEAEAILIKIAQGNGFQGKLKINLNPPAAVSTSQTKESVLTLFTSPRLLPMTLILCYTWFVVSGCYYGLTLAAGHMGTDIYTGKIIN